MQAVQSAAEGGKLFIFKYFANSVVSGPELERFIAGHLNDKYKKLHSLNK